jgi:AAA domain, putative AbiEii toxin, Type IV TA system/AAA domain
MIQSLTVKNFRAFDRIHLTGFGQVNLIGGLNNAGKTALLEALLLAAYPGYTAVDYLRRLRGENDEHLKHLNGHVWDHFFHNHQTQSPITLTSVRDGGQPVDLVLTVLPDFAAVQNTIGMMPVQNSEVTTNLLQYLSSSAVLHLQRDTDHTLIAVDRQSARLVPIGLDSVCPGGMPMLPSMTRFSDSLLADLYTSARPKRALLNEMLASFDSRIEGSELEAPGGIPQLNVILKGGFSLPLTMFGDAVRKMTELWLTLLTTQSPILLIDEIENGLHFSKHRDVWRRLFTMATEQKVQIFATSHSAEMIRAFNEVALSQSNAEPQAAYIEMSRSGAEGSIVGSCMDMRTLADGMAMQAAYRGE